MPPKRPASKESAPEQPPDDEVRALAALRQRLEETAAIVNWLGHDFGNVLTGVLGFAELARAQVSTGSEIHEFIQEIQRAAESGSALVRTLLLFGRRAPGQSGTTLLSSLLPRERPHWQEVLGTEHTLRLDVPADVPPVALAPEGARQLFEPLLRNARQALARPGTVTIAARPAELRSEDCATLLGRLRPGRFVEITVRDTGCGFSPEARRRWLTEPFFSTRPRHHGLGLPVVYGILCTHGGGFRIEGAEPAGTCVRVFLPVARA